MTTKQSQHTQGTVSQVIGPVIDVRFEKDVPEIYTALRINREGQDDLYLEVQQQLPGKIARTIAMSSTDGIKRGWKLKIQVKVFLFQLAKLPLDGCLTF